MPPDFVTPTGLSLPNLTDILTDVSDQQKAAIDPNLDTSPESVIGQFNGVYLANIRENLETIQIAYDGFNPDAAEGFALASLAALTGTIAARATFSRFTLTTEQTGKKLKVNLDANKMVPAGSIIAQVDNAQVQFITTEDVSSTTAGDYYVAARCTVTGPVTCNSGTLTAIQTPVSGWNSVTNEFDAILGTDVDTNQQLRERRENELHAESAGTVDGMLARLFAIRLEDGSAPIVDAAVVENATDFPDDLGRPPHCVEPLVYDGDGADCPDDVIAQVLWDSHADGIRVYGFTSSGTAVDTAGASHTMRFNRATLRPVKIQVDIVTTDEYAGDGAFKTALEAIFIATREKMGQSGRTVKWVDVADTKQVVTGVRNIVTIKIAFVGDSYPASFVDLAIGPRDMPTLDTSDIEIT